MSGGASDGIATFISPMPLGGLVGRCAAAVAVKPGSLIFWHRICTL